VNVCISDTYSDSSRLSAPSSSSLLEASSLEEEEEEEEDTSSGSPPFGQKRLRRAARLPSAVSTQNVCVRVHVCARALAWVTRCNLLDTWLHRCNVGVLFTRRLLACSFARRAASLSERSGPTVRGWRARVRSTVRGGHSRQVQETRMHARKIPVTPSYLLLLPCLYYLCRLEPPLALDTLLL